MQSTKKSELLLVQTVNLSPTFGAINDFANYFVQSGNLSCTWVPATIIDIHLFRCLSRLHLVVLDKPLCLFDEF